MTATLRPEVAAFAVAMQRKLDEHARKHIGCPGWKGCSEEELRGGLVQELRELGMALEEGKPESILSECADVANWCLFLSDVLGGLMAGVQPDA